MFKPSGKHILRVRETWSIGKHADSRSLWPVEFITIYIYIYVCMCQAQVHGPLLKGVSTKELRHKSG